MEATTTSRALSRRDLLRVWTAGGLTAAAGLRLAQGGARPAHAQGVITPADALRRLLEGNARYMAGQRRGDQEDLDILRERSQERQEPFAAVLSCADSRVPIEIVFDESIGHLFVARIAGNIATSEIVASLEYGAAVLGVKALMVLGHGSCGAVSAALTAKAVPGQISALYGPLRAALDPAPTNVDDAVRANAKFQARLLRTASPVLAGLVAQGKLLVVAAHYDLATGAVSLVT